LAKTTFIEERIQQADAVSVCTWKPFKEDACFQKWTVAFRSPIIFCLDYCRMAKYEVGGVFEAIKKSFATFNETDLFDTVQAITDFRNNYIAHQEKELTDINIAREGLIAWIMGIYKIYFTHH